MSGNVTVELRIHSFQFLACIGQTYRLSPILVLNEQLKYSFLPGNTSLTVVLQPIIDPMALLTLVRPNFLLKSPAFFSFVLTYSVQSARPTATTSSGGPAKKCLGN